MINRQQREEMDARHLAAVGVYYQSGDERALTEMLLELHEEATDYLWSKPGMRDRLRDKQHIQDMAQVAMMQLLGHLQARTYDPGRRPPGVLLCVLCRYQYLAYLRLKRITPSQPGSQEDPFLLAHSLSVEPAEENSDADKAQAARTVAAATQAVLSLDQPARSAVLLHFYKGLPAHQAAEQLGISEESYHARLNSGLAALRAWAQQQCRPTPEVYAALAQINTGNLFSEPLRMAG